MATIFSFDHMTGENRELESEQITGNDRKCRGIEWSLRALASMRAVRLFFASTNSDQICLASSEHFKADTDCEQRALCKFSRRNLDFSLLKRNVLRHAIWLTPLNQ